MKNSLEIAVESYFLELLRTSPQLKGKHFRHSDESREAETNCIIAEAVQGEDLIGGPKGPTGQLRSSVEVKIDYRSPSSATPKQNDIVIHAIMDRIKTAGASVTSAQKAFGRLDIFTEKITGDRSHTKNLRKRTITVPVEAGLK